MDSLASYVSDGEENSDNSGDTKMPEPGSRGGLASRRASDANYDPVQMDMSEESNNNNSSAESGSERANSPPAAVPCVPPTNSSRTESSRGFPSPPDQRRSDHESHSNSSRDEHKRSERSERNRHSVDKSRRSSHDDRRRGDGERDRDGKESKRSRDDDRRSRDEDRRKDRTSSGSCRDERNDDKEKSEKDHHHHHHHRDDRRERDRDRSERDRRRDRERDRRHNRDRDRSKERHREERASSYHREKDRTRSRSGSRDRTVVPPFRTMSYREEKGRNKLAQLEKLGIELKPPEGEPVAPVVPGEPNYYNPLATATQGKYAEQIQKRKLLWTNKSKPNEGKSLTATASSANTWVGTTFTHDQDGKVTAKFKRLMGIKEDLPAPPQAGVKPDILKKQEEMFNNMEQQYEVARATTHTQRGVGLGYATGGYQFPR